MTKFIHIKWLNADSTWHNLDQLCWVQCWDGWAESSPFLDANASNDIDPSRSGDDGLQNTGLACMLDSYYALGVYKKSLIMVIFIRGDGYIQVTIFSQTRPWPAFGRRA